MHDSLYNSYMLINLVQLRENVKAILHSLSPATQLVPVLKGNAYGLGIVPVAKLLVQLDSISTLAVSHVSEGILLRRSGITSDIWVIGGVPNHLVAPAVENQLTLTAGRTDLLPCIASAAKKLCTTAKVQIKIETGLLRTGVLPGTELQEVIHQLKALQPVITLAGAFSHFSDTGDKTLVGQQHKLFLNSIKQLEDAGISVPIKHICDSAASELYPEFHMDAVRIGRRLYMDHPTNPSGTIKECASWRTYITNLRHCHAGDTLGYGGKVVLQQDAVVATIGVGYGDGLNCALADCHAPVLIGGKRAPLLCCFMDQSIVDVTDIACGIGDVVTLFGYDEQGNALPSQEVSLLIGDQEGCGLTSALNSRVERIYT